MTRGSIPTCLSAFLQEEILPAILLRRTKVGCADVLSLPPRSALSGLFVLPCHPVLFGSNGGGLVCETCTCLRCAALCSFGLLTSELPSPLTYCDVCCRTVVLRKDKFDDREMDFYEALYTQSQAQFGAYVETGTVLNNYAHIFDLLIRLRQVRSCFLLLYNVRCR